MLLILFSYRSRWCHEFKLVQCVSEQEAREQLGLNPAVWEVEYADKVSNPALRPHPLVVWETEIEDLTYEG